METDAAKTTDIEVDEPHVGDHPRAIARRDPNHGNCGWCGMIHGPRCPSVKAIEYHPDGSVKRVEFYSPADYALPVIPMAPRGPFGYETTWSAATTIIPSSHRNV